jgi:adenosylcobinamide hydrolase
VTSPAELAALTWRVVPTAEGRVLAVVLAVEAPCLSSAVLGGGAGCLRTWVNLQVPAGYARADPAEHLAAAAASFPGPLVGMMTAAPVDRVQDVSCGAARVFATVGLGLPIAAATVGTGATAAGTGVAEPRVAPTAPPFATGAAEPRVAPTAPPFATGAAEPRVAPTAPPIGTINILAVLAAAVTPAGLVGAVVTATEAKAQALAAAGVPAANAPGAATGTASDAIAVACLAPPGNRWSPFCGPATPHGADLARAVFEAVLRGSRPAAPRRRVPAGRTEPPEPAARWLYPPISLGWCGEPGDMS